MKTKLYILMAAAALSMGTTSCTDFLDEDNKTGKVADDIYTTKDGIEGLTAACYTYARGLYGKEAGVGLTEMGTDLFYYGSDNKQKSLVTYRFDATALGTDAQNNPCIDGYWELFYSAVDVCNTAIKYINEYSKKDIKDNEKTSYISEAKFMRALYYFNMVNTWGAIPYNTEPVGGKNITKNPTRMPENEVYGNILADLDDAIQGFEAAGTMTKATERSNYWAARALKARVLLYAASWLGEQKGLRVEGNDNYSTKNTKQLYAAAEAEAEAVIAGSYAKLAPNYADVWCMENEAFKNNPEALFSITYSNEMGIKQNSIPLRKAGTPFASLITDDGNGGTAKGGSMMHLMWVSLWNNGANDLGGNGRTAKNVFFRPSAANHVIMSGTANRNIDILNAYNPYSKGFCRYLPSLRLWKLLNANRATDQRPEVTLLDHYDIADPLLAGNAKNYPELKDTAIYYSSLDGNSAEGIALQNWAKDRYRIQFATGGDIPVYTSSNPSEALPTETAKEKSDVYGDDRYNSNKIGGAYSYPGLKKFQNWFKQYDGASAQAYNNQLIMENVSSRDIMVLRISEMYLIAAEAEMKQGKNAESLTTINELRAARAIAGKDNSLSGTMTIDRILEERALEFCGEQQRWFDLKRTGKLYEYVKKYNAQSSKGLEDEKEKNMFLYRPIPRTEMEASHNVTDSIGSTTMMWQNPGF